MRRRGRLGATLGCTLGLLVTACAVATDHATSARDTRAVPVVSASDDPTVLTVGGASVDTWSGWLPDGSTLSPFDVAKLPIARLDPLIRTAIQDATRAAHEQGVDIAITSGWRSRGFQERLFADAVGQYGSVEAARRFVASPEVSKHVLGEAVDVTGARASEWLVDNGAPFGLCRIYANEDWHFELAVDQDGRCPPLRADAAG